MWLFHCYRIACFGCGTNPDLNQSLNLRRRHYFARLYDIRFQVSWAGSAEEGSCLLWLTHPPATAGQPTQIRMLYLQHISNVWCVGFRFPVFHQIRNSHELTLEGPSWSLHHSMTLPCGRGRRETFLQAPAGEMMSQAGAPKSSTSLPCTVPHALKYTGRARIYSVALVGVIVSEPSLKWRWVVHQAQQVYERKLGNCMGVGSCVRGRTCL
jgi:hypothetical protein